VGVSCQSLSISPQKTAYAPAKRNIIQQPYISTEILGTYNASSKTWTSNWTVPGDGEYIIMPNMVQTNGQQCAGNPAYSSTTRQGTMAGGGLTAGVTPCTGCHKTIAVDSSYGAKAGDISWLDWMYFPCVLLKTNLKDIYTLTEIVPCGFFSPIFKLVRPGLALLSAGLLL